MPAISRFERHLGPAWRIVLDLMLGRWDLVFTCAVETTANYSANATNSVFLLRAAFSLLVGFAASRHVLLRFTLTHLSAVSPQVSEVLLSYSNFP